jgi:hypothetical protein
VLKNRILTRCVSRWCLVFSTNTASLYPTLCSILVCRFKARKKKHTSKQPHPPASSASWKAFAACHALRTSMQERSSATSGVVANPSAALCAFSPTSTPIARGKLVKRKIRSTRSGFSCPADQQHLGLSLRIACHYRHGAVVIRGYEIRRQLRDRSEAQCRSGISR